MIYALDSNIISYILKEDARVIERFEKEIIHDGYPYVIPPVAVYELKRWLMEYKSQTYLAFAQSFDILYQSVRNFAVMSAPAWEKAAEIYLQLKQKGELIGDADILIAAYCLVNDYVLVTENVKHFNRVEGLKLVNWKE